MKRDFEIIRSILIEVENDTKQISILGCDQAVVNYHLRMLVDANFLEGDYAPKTSDIPSSFRIQRMSWSGHELLDSIRKPDNWDRIKKYIETASIPLTIEGLKIAIKHVFGDKVI